MHLAQCNWVVLASKTHSWLGNRRTDVANHIDYPNLPLHGLLEVTTDNYPDKTAVVCGEQELTYSQLHSLSNKFAASLAALGVCKGDRAALYMPNIPEFIIAFFGTLKVGATVTTISPLHREREVNYQLDDSGARTIVVSDTLYPVIASIVGKTQLESIITVGSCTPCNSVPVSLGTCKVVPLQQLLDQSSDEETGVEIDPNSDIAALQYTGGTTGTSKGAMLTHSNLVSNALAFGAAIKATAQDVFLTALPLFHIYGMTTSMTVPLSLGAKMILLSKFDSAKAMGAIEKRGVTVFCGVPTMYQMLIANPDLANYNLHSIRVCISGASALPPQVQRTFMDVTGGFLAEGYGLTEASPVTHCSPVDKPLKIGSIGVPLPDTEARVVDLETGVPLPAGQVGELSVRGPQVMKGYWRNPDETALVLHDGWLLTGDIAYMDDECYFYITDRKKDLIKTRGYSVYPRELEDLLYEHPAVKLCAVVGRPEEQVGEVPVAYVVLKDGSAATAEELMAFVNPKVAPYKAIRQVTFKAELPLSGAGKVLRRMLREQ